MFISSILSALLLMASCNLIEPEHDPITYGESYIPHLLSTDKAMYKPGEVVNFSLNSMPEQAVTVRYTHLGKVLGESAVTSASWTWQPPSEDFQGYMAELRTSPLDVTPLRTTRIAPSHRLPIFSASTFPSRKSSPYSSASFA